MIFERKKGESKEDLLDRLYDEAKKKKDKKVMGLIEWEVRQMREKEEKKKQKIAKMRKERWKIQHPDY